ncbi:peroxidase TAP [Punctularia strigosozonata HHB-11173 SS5]|uniref:peroxidase TAP n=1 Tax=Punctularia strigosozonata (strain HHB-11173) TaxID=741275 RepID=UPI00044182F6|nr:peroxidase TAP [Punctularia strigosozonata HHB-11173 SS5]EIN07199.1 peroxidase TAP [Punctularia strigosozonata HHB-11173 SS5]
MRNLFFVLYLCGLAHLGFLLGNASPPPQRGGRQRRQDIVRDVPLLIDYPGQTLLPAIEDILFLNLTNGSFITTDNIQGDILIGMKKPKETFLFFHINDAATFKSVLKNNIYPEITTTTQLISPPSAQPLALLNIAFTASGLEALNVLDPLGDLVYPGGQYADAGDLGDVTSNWEDAFKGTDTHGVFLIGSDQITYVNDLIDDILSWLGPAITVRDRIDGAARPGAEAGHEHFGFLDGISQPGVGGFVTNLMPGQQLVLPGTILTGHLGDVGLRPLWARDGSFLVFRKLQQYVPEFNKYLQDNAIQHPGLSPAQGAELLGARMVGRWKSGAPIDLFPTADNPAIGADPTHNNDFTYNHPLPFLLPTDQTYCPWTAHIRKTRPRADEVDVKAGIPYGPEVTADEAKSNTTKTDRGLAFVAYQSNIALGYRFQQTLWSNSQIFPPAKLDLSPGFDPLIGQNSGGTRTAGGLNPYDQTRDYVLKDFIVSRGGDYFFSPSLSAIHDVISA